MKKLLGALVVLLLAVLLITAGLADGTVSFAKTNGAVNGGFDYTVKVKALKPVSADTEVRISNKTTGEILTAVIKAGESEGGVTIPTEAVTKARNVKFGIEQSPDYQIKGKSFTLKIAPMPKVCFYNAVNYGYAGRKMSVAVYCTNSGSVVKGSTFQLKDQDGNVLAEKVWNDGSKRLTFEFSVTKDMAYKHLFSVWFNGIKVTAKDGYGALTDTSVKAVRSVPNDQNKMSITLDCGWYGEQMPLILPTLEKYNVRATFFMTGYFIRTFTQEAKDALALNCEIGCHTNTHPKLATGTKKFNWMVQFLRPIKNCKELLGYTPRLFRPPYGDYNKQVIAMCRAEGQEIILWTTDSHDWDRKYDFDKIWKRVTKSIKAGDILLFHLDGKYTPEILEKLIPYIQDELGLEIVPVTELLEAGGMELPRLIDADSDDLIEDVPDDDVDPSEMTAG